MPRPTTDCQAVVVSESDGVHHIYHHSGTHFFSETVRIGHIQTKAFRPAEVYLRSGLILGAADYDLQSAVTRLIAYWHSTDG